MKEIFPILIGGLALFLYAITQLSGVLKDLFSDKAKEIIAKYTSNLFMSLLIGILLTFLLDSSSAIIILAIVFINSGSLTFKQAIGIIMGANIGTTLASQVIALDVSKYSIIPLVIGLLVVVFIKKERIKGYGKAMFFLGMLFFGLFLMEQSVVPLRDSDVFEQWMARIENDPVQGALIGGLITLIIQSSGGTVGMAIVLGKQQLISISGGIAVMLGAELGTCSDTLIATIRGTRQAIKAGLFHLIFNLLTIIIGLLLFDPFVNMIKWITSEGGIGRHIANAHVIFNVAGVLLFLPFAGLLERLLNWMIPEKRIKTA